MPANNSSAVISSSNQALLLDKIKISLASPERIMEWTRGEVTKPETINYRTLKPERDGLFCEKIFGPSKKYECYCGRYKNKRYKGTVCEKCGVEVTDSIVRRERMGHIKLAAPVSHIWYFKGIPSRIGLILEISPKALDRVLYFAAYIVLEPGESGLSYKQVITDQEYRKALADMKERGDDTSTFRVGMGAEAIKELLCAIDLEKESAEQRAALEKATGQKRAKIVKQLEVIEAFRLSGNRPEWMILDVIPVIPPDLRPMVQLDGGRFATSDLNDLYRRIINRNNRLEKLLEQQAPEIIVKNEKRMLQEAVDALIDNGRRGRPVTGPGNRAFKSLSDMLKGKQGRFRQNLLGKRVDYSGRSVIVVGPELKIFQCGLPKEMAIELFKPFVMKELIDRNQATNVRNAKKKIERQEEEVWDVLEDVIREHPVMLNRAPTLHRLGIQAFEPILVEGRAIKLHPLVCSAFNADFDGDQMAVHLPLSVEAQAECRFLLLSPNNLLKPSDGAPVVVPTQDMILGIYYLTQERSGVVGEGMVFKNINEGILAYENGRCDLHARVKVRMQKIMPDGSVVVGMVESTLGRFIFNEILPQDLGIIDRSIPGNELALEVDAHVDKKWLGKLIDKIIRTHTTVEASEVLDSIKSIGYKYSTRAALTVSVSDMIVPPDKPKLISDTQKTVDAIASDYEEGLLTDEERYKAVIAAWNETDDLLTEKLLEGLDEYNNISMMAKSGARGSNKQIKQLAGMRGLMADTTGKTIELPIKSNFREGLDVLEYFISAHGARKGLSDTALRTADSGYLTRRLVDVSQDLIIREVDCCEEKIRANGPDAIPSLEISAIYDGDRAIETLQERMTGRYIAETIYDSETGEMIVKANHIVTPLRAARIMKEFNRDPEHPRTSVKIRTVLTCRSHVGVCSKCYGANMATGQPVQVGEAVGIIAAQSIGEPGTQLTMRTFHTGGVAGGDITQGLPRVEELFEARKPKGLAILTEIPGIATIREGKKKEVIVTNPETGESKSYAIPYGARLAITEGNMLEAGDPLTQGSCNPQDILRVKNVRAVQDYMIREVQRVYRNQAVDINDKHIEVIVRQMLKKVLIEEAGDSDFLPGTQVERLDFEDTNERLIAEGKEPVVGKNIIMGITKAALATTSFLSAASFQETTKVLTEAAINGKIDPLNGLKENVLIGKLIPAGSGLKRYRSIELNTDYKEELLFDEDDSETLQVYEEESAPAESEATEEEVTSEEAEPATEE